MRERMCVFAFAFEYVCVCVKLMAIVNGQGLVIGLARRQVSGHSSNSPV